MRRDEVNMLEEMYKLDAPEEVLEELIEERKTKNYRPLDHRRPGGLVRVGKARIKKLTRLLEIAVKKQIASINVTVVVAMYFARSPGDLDEVGRIYDVIREVTRGSFKGRPDYEQAARELIAKVDSRFGASIPGQQRALFQEGNRGEVEPKENK
jgi:hypothetical protein